MMKDIKLVSGRVGSGYASKFLEENKHVLNDRLNKVIVISYDFEKWKHLIEKVSLSRVMFTPFVNSEEIQKADVILTDDVAFLTKPNVFNSKGEIILFLQQSNI